MRPLTPRQQQILDLIREHLDTTGFPPTRAEIARQLGFRSANAAEEHLKALARKGMVELTSGASRGIRLLTEAVASSRPTHSDWTLPLIGRVSAGLPILAEEHVEARYALDPALFPSPPDYLLKVRGLSMKDAGILDGDLLAVRSSREAHSGQIVVARIGDEVTVKRLRRDTPGRIELLPENPAFEPIIVEGDEAFSIEGIGIGLVRRSALG